MCKQENILEPYYDTLKVVIKMAKEYYQEYKEEFDKDDTDGDGIVTYSLDDISIDDLIMKGKEKELYDFMVTLDYETIKVLQVIMYIGNGSTCMEEDGSYDYIKSRESFDFQGWDDDKSIEVSQMVDKVCLGEFLLEGCKRIGIKLF